MPGWLDSVPARFSLPVQELSKSINLLQSALASAERAFALLDEPPDVLEKPDARRLTRANGGISFRNVSFAYRAGDNIGLHDLASHIAPATRVCRHVTTVPGT